MATARKAPARASRKGDVRATAAAASAEKDDKAAAKRAVNAKRPASPQSAGARASSGAGESKAKAARATKMNGAAAPESTDDIQALVREGDDGEIVRKSRAGKRAEAAVPVQIGGLEPAVTRPAYWDRACADLVKRDRILKRLIPKFGPVHLVNGSDPFVTLARSVVGQQISVQAAQAVWERIEAACPKLAPQQFRKLGQEKLVACGLSKRKSDYLLDLAQHFVSGALHVDKWMSMDDEAVIAELTQIRGIGRWTAEMFLIFNLSRPDVLPLDDLGLIRAISVNYFSGEPVTRSEAREVAANWEPWRTVATWYMWRSLDGVVE
ncbi:MAG TPA: DNA-3-methyladenine glycosylase [Trinickia sp.]|jgi:DNA-3-methyladenine glycosylase II|nr:DNA-3-methyladenine glycosylase [Trinickia sp.]